MSVVVAAEGAAINPPFLRRLTAGGRRFPAGELGTLPPAAARGIIGACCPLADAVFMMYASLRRRGIEMTGGGGSRFAQIGENKRGGPERGPPVDFELLLRLPEGVAGVSDQIGGEGRRFGATAVSVDCEKKKKKKSVHLYLILCSAAAAQSEAQAAVIKMQLVGSELP